MPGDSFILGEGGAEENTAVAGIDRVDAFRAASGGEPLSFRHDRHRTPAGHRLFAAEVARRLGDALRKPPPTGSAS